jgi:hypothetical protein
MIRDIRQLDLFAFAEDVYAVSATLAAPSPGFVSAGAHQPTKRYMLDGPELELTAAEEDMFGKIGFRKLAFTMLMGAIDEVARAITLAAKEAALAYFTEEEGPLPFPVVLEWLGPPLSDFTPEQWARHVSMNPSAAVEGMRQYSRALDHFEVSEILRGESAAKARTAAEVGDMPAVGSVSAEELQDIRDSTDHVILVEDPVEFMFDEERGSRSYAERQAGM